ncbi:acyltransferase ChoActase/COT/CPT [Gorgonomyces haynaldii]|nr:acyltransferase ChoActase/COT/CPT [Gorgonomyces haynaldii]
MRTFENQTKLPKLPVPDLKKTIERYLVSIKPFATPEEEQEYKKICQDFLLNLGPVLQQRLIEHDQKQPISWLEDWWYRLAYLSWRESVLVHSNWYIIAQPHPQTPETVRVGIRTGYTDFQIQRAAGLTSLFLDYKHLIDTETLEPETTKQGPLCMNQYKQIFGVTRVPKPECDIIVKHPDSKHIVLLLQDQIFVVFVYDQDGKRIKIQQLEKYLECIAMVTVNKQPSVPLLSGQHRDDWARDHIHLESLGNNKDSFKWIETSLFAVCLDHKPVDKSISGLARNTFHSGDGHNRWFDKSISICVTNDGRAGMNGEHSPCDALVPALVLDYAVKREPAQNPQTGNGQVKKPFLLKWTVDDHVLEHLESAQEYCNKTIQDSDVIVHHFKGYGSDFIKRLKVSPDAFVQMCLQLTFYRIHGYCAGVYETSSTRQFLHGRTETCRSLTPAAKAFVLGFNNPTYSVQKKLELFRTACKAHVDYIRMSSQGNGVDRHLLGLRLVLKDKETHPIFTHPLFARSSKWQLSTSALFSGDNIHGTGFGTVYHDGYGMNYMVGKKMIKIGVESKFSDPHTSTDKFIRTLQSIYCEMQVLAESAKL